jgi:uncharacterized membrane protein YoaK (UPF0700 family)
MGVNFFLRSPRMGGFGCTFFVVRRFSPRWAVAAVLVAGTSLSLMLGQLDIAALSVSVASPVWTWPTFSWHATVNIAIPLTVLVLAFTMGLQNAVMSKISASQIRTTHMTGVITDMGIELGKLFYWNHAARPPELHVRANRIKLRLYAMLLGAFMMGGIVGAAGFKYLGFVWVLPMAGLLLLMSLPPLWADCVRYRRRHSSPFSS